MKKKTDRVNYRADVRWSKIERLLKLLLWCIELNINLPHPCQKRKIESDSGGVALA